MKSGCCKSHAKQLADVLVAADVRGHYSHGLNRLDMYMRDVEKKVCNGDGAPIILQERDASAWIDGNNLLGPVVGNYCIDIAVKKAKKAGVGFVVAKGSNHFGIAGWYSMRAMDQNCIGLAFTNTSPIMYPTRSSKAALGTNPLTIAAKGMHGDSFVLDMATTSVAIGKVEIASRKNQTIPKTWGVSQDGHVSTDPQKILKEGGLLPLGGTEIEGGYKGYGLAALVEIFCGILGGAHWGPNVRKWMSTADKADLGQCFIAIDPTAFAPNFSERLQKLMDTMRNLPSNAGKNVLIAGDPEREHIELVKKLNGIPYHPKQIEYAVSLFYVLFSPKYYISFLHICHSN
ncbi:unnamed protein product [Dracunculus medinensis]|uniref:Malate dehydrogenase n=1 Tax=Dracunculus medinensis TaxID=318479 RepID=A0A0N4UMN6_DRAME|nr:unnamed protein product [Dracunculus medinensis]